MGKYYNKTRGSLPVALVSGASMAMPPKQWIEIAPEEENSSSIANALSKGLIHRMADPVSVVVEPEAEPVVVEEPVTPVLKGIEKIALDKPVVADLETVVQNQTPKSDPGIKVAKANKSAESDKQVDEPKIKKD